MDDFFLQKWSLIYYIFISSKKGKILRHGYLIRKSSLHFYQLQKDSMKKVLKQADEISKVEEIFLFS
jgi:hypothetical protein